MPFITPTTDPAPETGCRKLVIPDDLRIQAAVSGALFELTKLHNWEQVDGSDLTPQETVDLMLVMMELFNTKDCGVIDDVRILSGTVQKLVDGEWVDVSTDASLDFCCTPYPEFTPTQDPQGDDFCFAAWYITDEWSDIFQDWVENIDAGLTITVGIIELIGVFPVVGSMIETVIEFLHDDLTQAVLDWVRVNITDPDAKALMAEQIYCALVLSEPSYEDFWDFVDYPTEMPVLGKTWRGNDNTMSWGNVDDTFNWAYGVSSGETVGWVTLLFIEILYWIGVDKLGLLNPMASIVSAGMAKKAFYAAYDCEAFDCDAWVIKTGGDDGEGIFYPHTAATTTWHETNKRWETPGGEALHNAAIMVDIPADSNLHRISVSYHVGFDDPSVRASVFRIFGGDTLDQWNHTDNFTGVRVKESLSEDGAFTLEIVVSGSGTGSIDWIDQVTLWGAGVEPT